MMPRVAQGALPAMLIGLVGLLGAGCSTSDIDDTAYEEAIAAAATEGKLVVASFTANWCGPCRTMESTTWTDATVQQWIDENAIRVRVDIDRRKDLASQFDVRAIPTTVVLEGTHELSRVTGLLDAARAVEWLRARSAEAGTRGTTGTPPR